MSVIEIKNVVKETNYEYPKLNQIDEKRIQNNIPNKWIKVGLSSLVISFLVNNKVIATNVDVIKPEHLGGITYSEPISIASRIATVVIFIIALLSIFTFIITGFSILIAKIKSKKVKKWIKVIFIISIILSILGILISFLL